MNRPKLEKLIYNPNLKDRVIINTGETAVTQIDILTFKMKLSSKFDTHGRRTLLSSKDHVILLNKGQMITTNLKFRYGKDAPKVKRDLLKLEAYQKQLKGEL